MRGRQDSIFAAKAKRSRQKLWIPLLLLLAAAVVGVAIWLLRSTGEKTPPTSSGTPSSDSAARSPKLSDEQTARLTQTLGAQNAVLYDVTRGTLLYGKNEAVPCSPASLTKLLTAAVALEYLPAETELTVGTEISFEDAEASTAGLRVGSKLTVAQLLDGLLLPSGGDAAYVLAVNAARKTAPERTLNDWEAATAFCDLLNEKAAALGANNTYFVNPDGIYATRHRTTAADMARILQHAMSFPEIRAAVAKPSVRHTLASGQEVYWGNTNLLVNPNSPYYYSYAKGGKTGHTDEAGYCLGAFAERDGTELIAIVFGCSTEAQRFTDVAALFEAGFALAAGQ